ncbi:hypothetical protein [Pseudanabaena mucicola]|uniref:PEP-CTERM sorting domain-containing protein n=1 Tax=Pseudanabaena mucicola FACHB-723 TaxID=2692860 RepID=A0ABR7ZTR9_9CYAN|nr:hypothetical protein [Pseudanabaena mucicola]MBD2187384.1 hypothetical protein [Pseudanabaena mucicola FACHB-723]
MNKNSRGKVINLSSLLIFSIFLFLPSSPSLALTTYNNTNGNVTWGNNPDNNQEPIVDIVPPASKELVSGEVVPTAIRFNWTKGEFDPVTKKSIPHPEYEVFYDSNEDPLNSKRYTFTIPKDKSITDWTQTIRIGNGKEGQGGSTTVYGGNIIQESPWQFRPLSELPDKAWRIPDVAPLDPPADLTIYTAVNLGLYISKNPNGFLNGNWSVGQTLDTIGVTIVNGRVAGLEGIYFSTSDFTFDPNSETGWVPIDGDSAWLNSLSFQSENGALYIPSEHSKSVPVPSSVLGTLAFGAFATGSVLKRKLKQKKLAKLKLVA